MAATSVLCYVTKLIATLMRRSAFRYCELLLYIKSILSSARLTCSKLKTCCSYCDVTAAAYTSKLVAMRKRRPLGRPGIRNGKERERVKNKNKIKRDIWMFIYICSIITMWLLLMIKIKQHQCWSLISHYRIQNMLKHFNSCWTSP